MGYLSKLKSQLKSLIVRKWSNNKYAENEAAIYDEELRPGSRLWLFLLCLSSAVILTKYLSESGCDLAGVYRAVFDVGFYMFSMVNSTIENVLTNFLAVTSQFHWILFPSIFSSAFIGFSWLVLYKDSDIPGINPPTPFSPTRFRRRKLQWKEEMSSSHPYDPVMHLTVRSQCDRSMDFSYALTGTFGILIFLRLLYQSLKESY